MRKIGLGTAFRRDCKRIRKSGRGAAVKDAFRIVHALANDEMLPTRNHDHPLHGRWSHCRECHVRPDLVLIYKKPDAHHLNVLRLGSHSHLGL